MAERPRRRNVHYVMLLVGASTLAIAAELADRTGRPSVALFAWTLAGLVGFAFLVVLAIGTERKM